MTVSKTVEPLPAPHAAGDVTTTEPLSVSQVVCSLPATRLDHTYSQGVQHTKTNDKGSALRDAQVFARNVFFVPVLHTCMIKISRIATLIEAY